MDEVKAIITLRSGKKVDQPIPKPLDATKEQQEEESERIVIKEDMMKRAFLHIFLKHLEVKRG